MTCLGCSFSRAAILGHQKLKGDMAEQGAPV